MRTRLSVTLVAALVLLTACGSLTGPAATVDGTDISEEDLRDELVEAGEFAEANPAQASFYLPTAEGNFTRDAAREVLRQRIQDVLVGDELADRGGQVTDVDVAPVDTTGIVETPWLDTFLQRQERIIALQRVVLADAGLPATAEEWYAENAADLGLACTSHILLESEADAEAALERALAGEDFAELARELSVGPSAPNGGDLGCTDPSGFVAEFADAIRAAEVGVPTGPVETEFGWHVILVRSRGADVPFEEAAEDVTALYDAETQGVLNVVLGDLVRDADVEVSSRYGTWVEGQIIPDDLVAVG